MSLGVDLSLRRWTSRNSSRCLRSIGTIADGVLGSKLAQSSGRKQQERLYRPAKSSSSVQSLLGALAVSVSCRLCTSPWCSLRWVSAQFQMEKRPRWYPLDSLLHSVWMLGRCAISDWWISRQGYGTHGASQPSTACEIYCLSNHDWWGTRTGMHDIKLQILGHGCSSKETRTRLPCKRGNTRHHGLH